jgi:hypothetical protein
MPPSLVTTVDQMAKALARDALSQGRAVFVTNIGATGTIAGQITARIVDREIVFEGARKFWSDERGLDDLLTTPTCRVPVVYCVNDFYGAYALEPFSGNLRALN